ncbi:hypothetical protein [Streptomyces californicus]|uniref:hypothetical protein n=1 Tax=Streptomyces californicus TaxID=67351 RepID=UPI0004BFB609|nr:hypothetical protein [Streptomyces californicus]QRV59353.1 hypothetical protein I6J40_34395 [Streptomyces californicus]
MATDIRFRELQKAVTDLGKQVVRASEVIQQHGKFITDQAQDTARTAEGIAAMGVDPDTVAETQHLARLMDGLADSAHAYASAADTTAKSAQAAHAQNQASHGGIAEAVSRSAVGVKELNREWLRQQ